MFPGRYFAARYFPPRYFPGAGNSGAEGGGGPLGDWWNGLTSSRMLMGVGS